MSTSENWGARLFLIFASISLPVCVFYPSSPNVTFSALGLCSLGFVLLRKELKNLVPPLHAICTFLVFTTWALIACLWSSTPETSLLNVGKIALAVLGAVSFYAAQTQPFNKQFSSWYFIGYYVALFLLILDEIINTHILRTLRGQSMDTPEYYHGVTLLVLSLWPLLNTLKGQHAGVKGLIIVLLGLGVFEMTDHAAKLALVLGLIAWAITYLNPRLILRAAAVLSAVILLAFPFALKEMDPAEVIHSSDFLLLKTSYHHRLFILKRTTNMIFEKPWIGHGLDFYRSTINKQLDPLVAQELDKIIKNPPGTPYNLDIVGQTTHPHNLSLQIWLELGAVGALLYALFILTSLWRLSGIQNRRYELSTFMGLYTSSFIIAHISFGAWQTWWLFSVGIILSLILWQITRAENNSPTNT